MLLAVILTFSFLSGFHVINMVSYAHKVLDFLGITSALGRESLSVPQAIPVSLSVVVTEYFFNNTLSPKSFILLLF